MQEKIKVAAPLLMKKALTSHATKNPIKAAPRYEPQLLKSRLVTEPKTAIAANTPAADKKAPAIEAEVNAPAIKAKSQPQTAERINRRTMPNARFFAALKLIVIHKTIGTNTMRQ